MKKKICKCLSVLLSGWMCLPTWAGTSFSGSQMTDLNGYNNVKSHSSNINGMTADGRIDATGPTAWVRWNKFSIDDGKTLCNAIDTGRMYFIVDKGSASQINGNIVNFNAGTGFYLINPSGIGVGGSASFNANGGQIGLISGTLIGNFDKVFNADGTITDATTGKLTGYPVVNATRGSGGTISLKDGASNFGNNLLLVASQFEVGGSGAPGNNVMFIAGESVAVKNIDAKYLSPADLGDSGDLTVSFTSGAWDDTNSSVYNFIAAGNIDLAGSADAKNRMTISANSISIRAGADVNMSGNLTLKTSKGDVLSSRINVSALGNISLYGGVELKGPKITDKADAKDGLVLLSAGNDILLQGATLGDASTPSRAAELQAGGSITLDGVSKAVDLNVQSFRATAGGDIQLKGTVDKLVLTAKPAGGDNEFALEAGGIIEQVKPTDRETFVNALKFVNNGKGTGVDSVKLTAAAGGLQGADAIVLDGDGNSGLFNQQITLSAGSVQSPLMNVSLASAEALNEGQLTGAVGGELSLKAKTGGISVDRASFERLGTLSATAAGGIVVKDTSGSSAYSLGLGQLVSTGSGDITVDGKYIYTKEGGEIKGGSISLISSRNLNISDGTTISGFNVTLGTDNADSTVKIGDGVKIAAQSTNPNLNGDVKIMGGNIDIGTRGGDATTIKADRTLEVYQRGETLAVDENHMGDHLYVEENAQLLSAKSDGVALSYAGELWLFGQAMNQGSSPQKARVEPLSTSTSAKVKAMSLDMVGQDLTLAGDDTWSDVHWIGYYNVGANATVTEDIELIPTTGTGLPTDDRASYIRGAGDLTFSVAEGKTLSSAGGITLVAKGDLTLAGNGTLDTDQGILSLSGKNISQDEAYTGLLKADTVNLMKRTADEGLNQTVALTRLQADALSGVGGKVQITAAANNDAEDFTIAGDVTAGSLYLNTMDRNVESGADAAGRTAYTMVDALSIQAGKGRTVSLTTPGDFNFSAKDASGKEIVSLLAKSANLTLVNEDKHIDHNVKLGSAALEELKLYTESSKGYVGESGVSVSVKNESDNLKVVNVNNVGNDYLDLKTLSVDQTGGLEFNQKIVTSGDLTLRATGKLGLATELAVGESVVAVNDVRGKVALASGEDLTFRNQGDLELVELTANSADQAQTMTLRSDTGSIVVDESALNLNGTLNLESAKGVAIAKQAAYKENTRKGWNGQLGDVTAVDSVSVVTLGALTLAGNLTVGGVGDVTLSAKGDILQNDEKKIVASGTVMVTGNSNVSLLGDNEILSLAGSASGAFAAKAAHDVSVGKVTAGDIDISAANNALTVDDLLTATTVRLAGNTVNFGDDADFKVSAKTEIDSGTDVALTMENRAGRHDEFGALSVTAGTDEEAKKITITDNRSAGSGVNPLSFGLLKGSDVTLSSKNLGLQFGGEIDAKGSAKMSAAGAITFADRAQVNAQNQVRVESADALKIGKSTVIVSDSDEIQLHGFKGVVQDKYGVIKATSGDVTITADDYSATVALDGSVEAGQKFEVTSDSGLTLRNVVARDDIDLSVNQGDIKIQGTVESTAGSLAVVNTGWGGVTLAGDDEVKLVSDESYVKVVAMHGNLKVGGDISAKSTVTLQAGENVIQEKDRTIQAGGNVDVKAGGAVQLNGKVDTGWAFTVDTGSGLILNDLNAVSDVDLNVANGSMTLNGAIDVSEGSLNLYARDDIAAQELTSQKSFVKVKSDSGKVTAEQITAGTYADVSAGSALVIGKLEAKDDTRLQVKKGDLTVGKSIAITDGTLTLQADEGSIYASSGNAKKQIALESAGLMTVNAAQNVTLQQATAKSGNLEVTAVAGKLTVAKSGRVAANSGDITLVGSTGITIEDKGSVEATGGTATLTVDDGSLTVGGNVAAEYNVAMHAPETISVSGSITANDGNVELTGANNICIAEDSGVTARGADGNVLLEGKQIEIKDLVESQEGSVTINGVTGVSQSDTSQVNAGRNVTINASNKSADVLMRGSVSAGKILRATAGRNVTLAELEAGTLEATAGQQLSIADKVNTTGDVTLKGASVAVDGDMTAGGAVYAEAKSADIRVGGLIAANGGTLTLVADAGSISANCSLSARDGVSAKAKKTLTVEGEVVSDQGDVDLSANENLVVKGKVDANDVTANAAVISISGAVVADGKVQARATTGDLTVGGAVTAAGGALTLAADLGNITVKTLTANDDLSATAAGAVNVKGSVKSTTGDAKLIAGGLLTVSGGVQADAGDVELAGDAGVKQLAGSEVMAGKDLTVTAANGDVTLAGTVKTMTGGVTLTAAQKLSVASGEVNANTDAILNGAVISVDGAVVAGGKVQARATEADLTVGGAVTAAGGALTLVADKGDITVQALTARDNLTATAAGSVDVNGNVKSNTGDAKLTAGGLLTVSGGVQAEAGDIKLAGDAGVKQSAGSEVNAGKDLTVTAVNGDVTLAGTVTTMKGSATLTAGQKLSVAGGEVNAKTDAILNGAGISVDGAVVAGGKVQARATTDNLTVGGVVTAAGGALTLAADLGNVTVQTLTARDNLSVTAAGTVIVNGNVKSTIGDAKLTAGDLLTVSGGVQAEAGDVKLAGTSVSVSGVVSAGEDFEADAQTGNLDLSGVVTVGSKTRLTAAGSVRATNRQNDFGGKVTASAAGDIKLANRADKTLTVGDLTAGSAGAVTIKSGDLASEGAVTISGQSLDIDATDGAVNLWLISGRTINSLLANSATITADDGALDIVSSRASALNLKASNDLTVQGNVGDLQLSAVTSGGAVNVTTSGDLDISALTAGKNVVLTATGSDSDIRAASAVKIGGTAALTADGDIVMDNAANRIVGNVTAISAAGDVSLANSRALTIDELQANTATLWAKGGVSVAQASVDEVAATAQGGVFDFTNDRDLTLLALTAASAKLTVAGNLAGPNVVNLTSGQVALDVTGTAELHNKGSLAVTSEGALDVNGISSEHGDVTITAATIVQTVDSSVVEENGVVDIDGLKAGVVAKNGTVTLTATASESEGGIIGAAEQYVTVEAKTVNAEVDGEMHLARLNGDWIIGSASDGSVQYKNLLDLVVEGKLGTASDSAYTGSEVSITANSYLGIQRLEMDAGGELAVKRTDGSPAPQYPIFVTVNDSSVPSVATWNPHNLVYVTINGNQYPMTPEFMHMQTMTALTASSAHSPSIGPAVVTPKLFGLINPFWVTADLGTIDLIGCGVIDLQLDKSVEVETKGDWPEGAKPKSHAKDLSPEAAVFFGRTVSMK